MIRILKQIIFLTKNEIKKIYIGSYFGTVWFFLNPIIYSLIYYFLFDKIISIKFNLGKENISYFEYLIVGLILWNSFTMSILRASISILENSYILKKVLFPPEYIVISYSLVYYLQGIIFLSSLIFFFKIFSITLISAYIISSITLFLFILGISFILSALTVYIRDLVHLISNLFNFLFYTVPIIYPYKHVPNSIKAFIKLNPIFHIFKPFYDILLYKSIEMTAIFFNLFISILFFFLGFMIFRKLKEGFYDVL